MREEPFLAGHASAVAAKPVLANDAMARHHDLHRVGAIRGADGPHGPRAPDAPGQLRVGDRAPRGNLAKRRPDVALERCAAELDRDGGERRGFAGKEEPQRGNGSGRVVRIDPFERSEARLETGVEARGGIDEAGGDEGSALRGDPERACGRFNGGV